MASPTVVPPVLGSSSAEYDGWQRGKVTVDEPDGLATEFEAHRRQLRQMAYRMLGSTGEADDAVQETWLRLTRSEVETIENLPGWLRSVLSRICLDMLRARDARREDLVGHHVLDDAHAEDNSPEEDAVLVDSVGRALLVVLDRLEPAERVAFVLHDVFALPFAEIAPVVDRSAATTKKLASRARQRVRGVPSASVQTAGRHRRVVEAFLAASRAGDIPAILAVLAPDVVRKADPAALPPGRPAEAHGADVVADEIAVFGKRARHAAPVLIDGRVGVVVAPHGRLQLLITFTITDEKITSYELIADATRLRRLTIQLPDADHQSIR